MEQIIRKFYRDMLKDKGCGDKISRKTLDEVTELGGYGGYSDMLLLAASAAEENGFVEGFKYAFHLFAECMRE